MGDHEGGPAGEQRRHRGLDELLAFRVQVAGGFVEDQDLGRREDRPGDGQPLLLAAGELDAALADERLVLFGKFDDELVRIGAAGGVFDLGVRGVVPAVGDVVPHRAVEEEHVLLHDGQQVAIGAQPKVPNVGAVEQNAAPGRIVKPRDQVGHRRLAGAAPAHQGDHRSAGHDRR